MTKDQFRSWFSWPVAPEPGEGGFSSVEFPNYRRRHAHLAVAAPASVAAATRTSRRGLASAIRINSLFGRCSRHECFVANAFVISNWRVTRFFKRSAVNHSSKYRRTIQALAAGICLPLIFSGCGKPGDRAVLANVIFVRGNVVFDNGKERARHSQSVTTATKLSAGDRFETLPDAAAALSLIPGIFIQIGGGTEIVIEELRVWKRGDAMVDAMRSRLATLRINRGVIRAFLPDAGSGQCELKVQTDLGTVAAQRGALVSVRWTNGAVRIVCVDGEVHWRSATGGRVDEIPEGYFQDHARNAVSSNSFKPEPTPVSDDAGAQNDVATALDAAAAFEEFILRVRNAPAPKSSHPVKP